MWLRQWLGVVASVFYYTLYGVYVCGSFYVVWSTMDNTAPIPKLVGLIEQVCHLNGSMFVAGWILLLYSWNFLWRLTPFFMRICARYYIPGTRMMTQVQQCGMLARCLLKLGHSLSTCISFLHPPFSIETTIQCNMLPKLFFGFDIASNKQE